MSKLSQAEIRRLCGDLTDERVAEMIATGATVEDLEIALAWSAGESDVMGEERKPLSGRSAQIYELLTPELDEEEDPSRPV